MSETDHHYVFVRSRADDSATHSQTHDNNQQEQSHTEQTHITAPTSDPIPVPSPFSDRSARSSRSHAGDSLSPNFIGDSDEEKRAAALGSQRKQNSKSKSEREKKAQHSRSHADDSDEDKESEALTGAPRSVDVSTRAAHEENKREADEETMGGEDMGVEVVRVVESSVVVDDADDECGDTSGASASAVFARPLVYYERQHGARQRQRQYRQRQNEQPTEVFLPNNSICLGFPLNKAAPSEGANEPQDLDNLVVFSSPTEEQLARGRIFICLLYFLIPIDAGLISALFFYNDLSRDTTFSNGSNNSLTYSCTMIQFGLAFLAMHTRSTRLMTMFLMLFYVDSLLNLLRAYSVLQFTHFVIQLGICHVMAQLKITSMPAWFAPVQ